MGSFCYNRNMQKRSKIQLFILGFLLLVLIFFSFSVFKQELGNQNATVAPIDQNINSKPLQKPKPALLSEQEKLLEDLKNASDRAKREEDYLPFAKYLKSVYEKGLDKNKQFMIIESDLYVFADKGYFVKGNYNKSLEFSTIVYSYVPMGWRFAYLRILSLEALGRAAIKNNDIQRAEEYAMTILQMTYRLEGANLLADLYIKKIEKSINENNSNKAARDLDYILGFEISQDRKDKLNSLKKKIGGLGDGN